MNTASSFANEAELMASSSAVKLDSSGSFHILASPAAAPLTLPKQACNVHTDAVGNKVPLLIEEKSSLNKLMVNNMQSSSFLTSTYLVSKIKCDRNGAYYTY